MADRFVKYEPLEERIFVEEVVLFGDCKDTKVQNSNREPIQSYGGTITYKLRPSTKAVKGFYQHSKIVLGEDKYCKGRERFVHLFHHEDLDGAKIGQYLCRTGGHDDFRLENTWSRYDWCHYRNWGCNDYGDDTDSGEEYRDLSHDWEGSDVSLAELNERSWESCSSEDSDERAERKERENPKDLNMYFVSTSGGKELGRVAMDTDCIEGDWHYGLRVTDPETKLSFAYVFGDCFVNDILSGDVDYKKLVESTFDEPMANFKK